ncbi:MAG: HEPN domain-containing protein [Promethearchaeia archaeon]
MKRYKDWLEQAEKDLNAAQDSEKTQHFEWACFQAQQSAEKYLKAFLLYLNIDSWGHGLIHLFQEINQALKGNYEDVDEEPIKEKKALKERCQELDRHYIQPRNPNGFASGHPAEYYNKKVAKRCIKYAEYINRFVKEKIEKLSSS